MRGKLALVVAIVLGLVAVLGFRSILTRQTATVEQKLDEVDIMSAAEMIRPGTTLDLKMVVPMKWPKVALAADNILWDERFQYLSQPVARNIERNEAILKSYFRQTTVEVGTTLLPGQVAITFRVDDVSGVAGTIRPGDHVDVIGTLPLPVRQGGGGGDITTERLLNDCTVLAVDNRTALTGVDPGAYGRGGATYSTITLALTPKEAVILTYAQAQGKITFALRNRTDPPDPAEPPEIKLTNVRDEAAKANAERKSRASQTPSRATANGLR